MDKKITGLNPAGTLSANDTFPVCQNAATGELLEAALGDLRAYVLGGANAGARIYFNTGVPGSGLGVDGDVYFDKQAKNIYQKVSGAWVFQDSYGSSGGVGVIRFTSVYDSDGLSADGLAYHNDDLVGGLVTDFRVDATPLIQVEELGDTPAFDEFDFDNTTGDVSFGAPLPAGFRITITYSV